MNNTTNIQTETPRPVRCSAWLGDFAECLRKRKAKLRAGFKMTVDTETFTINVLPTIEVSLDNFSRQSKWLPLQMPDGRWYFDSESERDEVMNALMSPNESSSATRRGAEDSR